MALTKAHIVEMIAEQNGFPKNKSVELVESLIEIIKRTLEAGDDVLVSGFGKFCVKSKGSRRGRNPATGSDLMLSARKMVTFKWGNPNISTARDHLRYFSLNCLKIQVDHLPSGTDDPSLHECWGYPN